MKRTFYCVVIAGAICILGGCDTTGRTNAPLTPSPVTPPANPTTDPPVQQPTTGTGTGTGTTSIESDGEVESKYQV
jgi:hypothetical protein